ncbi:MAG TPA: hypothetical protein VNW46_09385 [Gemmatimonadaceae bacterium]|jgi:hypothetical protein|nr:hypothetical protein [Gemmatimonadaceae bacterium]
MDLDACLAASRATAAFAADVRAYADHREAPRIAVLRAAPRVKVLRVVTQLLHAEPALPVECVRVDGVSGCADYRGTVIAVTPDGERGFAFVWDCSWRAAVEGWLDRHGLPDQTRAAREFGWQCFAAWAPHAALASQHR